MHDGERWWSASDVGGFESYAGDAREREREGVLERVMVKRRGGGR